MLLMRLMLRQYLPTQLLDLMNRRVSMQFT